MTKYRIIIDSKKKSSNHFLKFVKKSQNFKEPLHFTRRKKRRKRISVLKSPHINKKAQEQFQFITFNTQFTYLITDTKKEILFLKKIKDNIFPGTKIKIENIQTTHRENSRTKFTNNSPLPFLTSYRVRTNKKVQQKKKTFFKRTNPIQRKQLLKKTITNLKNLDLYGRQK